MGALEYMWVNGHSLAGNEVIYIFFIVWGTFSKVGVFVFTVLWTLPSFNFHFSGLRFYCLLSKRPKKYEVRVFGRNREKNTRRLFFSNFPRVF